MGRAKQKPPQWHQQFMDGYTGFPNAMLASEAVRTLLPSHFMVLVIIAMHLGKAGTKKNGKLAFPNRAGCPWWDNNEREWVSRPVLYFTRSTTGDALREFEARGLIKCTQRYSFDQKRKAKEYRLTWIKTEEGPATNEWLAYRHPLTSRPPRGNKEKARPTTRPVGTSIGRPVGQPSEAQLPDTPLQADQSAYSVTHRPTHRPHCYHVIDAESGHDGDGAARALPAQRASAAAPMPADTHDTKPCHTGPGGAAVTLDAVSDDFIALAMAELRAQVRDASNPKPPRTAKPSPSAEGAREPSRPLDGRAA